MPTWQDYATFVRSLHSVSERETETQLVFSLNETSFCWVSKNITGVQLLPPLGKISNPTRKIKRDGRVLQCIRLSNGNIDAQYDDPNHVLKPLWSYVGFRLTDCSLGYGCDLIKQAYEQVRVPHKADSGKTRPRVQGVAAPPLTHAEPKAPTFEEIKNRIEEMRDHIVQMLRGLSTATEREDPAAMISRLQREGFIPGNIASMMHLIRSARNRIKYENHLPSNSEWLALQNAWTVIDEWWKQTDGSKLRERKG